MKEPKKISSEIEKINMKPLSIGLRRLHREHLTKKKFRRKFRLSHSCISRICRQLLNMELKLRREKQRTPLTCIEKNQFSSPNLNCSTWKRPAIVLSNIYKKNYNESPRKKMKYENEPSDKVETQFANSLDCKKSPAMLPEKLNYSTGIDVKRFSIITKDGLQTINTKSVSLPRKKLNSLSSPVKLDKIIKEEPLSPKPPEKEEISVPNENVAPGSSAPVIRVDDAIKRAFLDSEEVVDSKEHIPTSTSIDSLPGNKKDFQNSEEMNTCKTTSEFKDSSEEEFKGFSEGLSRESDENSREHSVDNLRSDERERSPSGGKTVTSEKSSSSDSDDESTLTGSSNEDGFVFDPPFDPAKFLSCDIATDAQEEEFDRVQFKSQHFQLNCELKIILKPMKAADITNTFCFHNNISGMCGFRLRQQLCRMKFTAVIGQRYKPVSFSKPEEPQQTFNEPPEYMPGPPEDPFTHSLFAPIIKADEKKRKRQTKVVHSIYKVAKKPNELISKAIRVIDHRRPVHLTHLNNLPPSSVNYPHHRNIPESPFSKYVRISVPPGKPMTLSRVYSPVFDPKRPVHPANSSFPPQTGLIPHNRLAFPSQAGVIPHNSAFPHQAGVIPRNSSGFLPQATVIPHNNSSYPPKPGVLSHNNSPFPPPGGSFIDGKISRPVFVTPANNIIRPLTTNLGVPSALPQNVNYSYIVLPPNATIPQVQEPNHANPTGIVSQGAPVGSQPQGQSQPLSIPPVENSPILSSGGQGFNGTSTTTYCRSVSSENFCPSNSLPTFSSNSQSSYINNPSYKQPTNLPNFYSNLPGSVLRMNPSISEKIVASTLSSSTPTFQPTLTPSFPTTSHLINSSMIPQSPVPINNKPYFLVPPNSHLNSPPEVNFTSQTNNNSSLPINAPPNPCNIDQPPILQNTPLMSASNDQLSSAYTGVTSDLSSEKTFPISEQTPAVAIPPQFFPSSNSESREDPLIGRPPPRAHDSGPPPLKLGNVPVENPGGTNSQPPLLKMVSPAAPEDKGNSALSNFDEDTCNFEKSSNFDEYKEDALRRVTDFINIFLTYGFSKEPSSVFNAAYQMLLANVCCKPHALSIAKQISFPYLSVKRGNYTPSILDMPTLPLTQAYEELEISYDLFILKRFIFAVDKESREVLYPLPPLCNLKENNFVDKISVVVMISPRFGLGPGIVIFPHAILDRKLRLSFGSTGPLSLNWVMSAHQRGGLTQSMMLEFLNGEGLNWLRTLGLSGSNIRLGVDWWWCIDKTEINSFYSKTYFQNLHLNFPNHRDPLDLSVSVTLERVWGMLVRKWCSSHSSKLLEDSFPRFIYKTLEALCELKRLRAWCRVGGLYPLDFSRIKEFLDATVNEF